MTDVSDYALMAGAVYQSNKAVVNLSPVPTGWERGAATYERDADTGFEADTFINFQKKEIVIGFAGTNFEFEKAVDFGWANIPLGVGLPSPQAAQAAVYYKKMEATYANLIGAGYSVSLTGHSLGGGLAALVSVWFDRPATVFDDAPFSASTTSPLVVGTVETALQLQGYSDPKFAALTSAISSASGSSIADPRRSNVNSYAVTGEVLSGILSQYLRVNTTTTKLASDGTRLGGADLHSIALLQAYELCGGFSAALQKNAGFLSYLMRSGQYGSSPLSDTPNVLAQLVKSQVQGSGGLNSLTNDLETLAAAPMSAAEKTLLRFAVADSYANQAQQGSFGQLFTELGPGSTLAGVLDETALTADNVVNGFKRGLIAVSEADVASLRTYMSGTDAVAATLVSALLDGTFSTAQDGQLSVSIPGQPKSLAGLPSSYLNDRLDYTLNWLQGGTTTRPDYLLKATGKVFFGSPPANTTATAGDDVVYCSVEGGIALGGSGADILYGVSGADVLDGGEGKDFLYGGAGDDWLGYTSTGNPGSTGTEQVGDSFNGGLGDDNISGTSSDDTYTFAAGDGQDTVRTQGGKDKLVTSGGYTYFKREGIDLLVKVGPVSGTNDFTRVADWFTPGTEKNQLWLVDANGVNFNRYALTSMALHVEGSDDADTFDGVSGYSDVINGNGGDDTIDVSASGDIKAADEVHGGGGNDEITAGNSNDFLYGDDGDDVVDGGTGNDHLEGGAGNDSLYSWGGTSTLDGGDGDDFVYSQGTGATLEGGDGADYVYAKGTQNTLRGGAGRDTMRTRGSNLFADGGADEDWLLDQGSNNVLYGGAGDDSVTLQGTGATAYGGAGFDYLENYGSGNTLDGGADNDFYYSANSSFTVVMSETSGHDMLAMDLPTTGVLRVTGVLSGALTTYVDGTSLVLSTGTSSLTILNYIVDGAVNTNFQGIELDDKTLPTSELPHPDTSTIRGTAGVDWLQGNGVASRIIGMGGDDYLFGSGATETFEWSQGDGLDTVMAQSSDIASFQGDGYSVLAHRTGNDLTLTTSAGGGYVIPSWFIGQNQMSIKAPDGTVWSAAEINEQFGEQTYLPSTVAIGQNSTAYWTGGAPVVFGSEFAGRDIQATLSYHNYVSPSHYDLTLSDGQGTSFTFEDWSQGNVSSVTMPDGTMFTPSQLNGMLHPAAYSVGYDHVYSQNDWQSVVSSLGPGYNTPNLGAPWVGAFMAGQQTGMYQGTPEPEYAIRRFTVTSPTSLFASSGTTHPDNGEAAVQSQVFITSGATVTFDFWGSPGNYRFAIVDASSSYTNVYEQRVQLRDENGALQFDNGNGQPIFGNTWQVVSSTSDNSGYHDTPNVTTTRTAHLTETLYEAGTVEPPVDSFTLFDAGSAGARAMASAWGGMSTSESTDATHVATGYLGDWGAVPLTDAGATAVPASAALGSSLSQATIDAWRRAASRLGEDLELPTKVAATGGTPVLVSTGYLAQREFGEVPVTTGVDPLFGRPTAPVPYTGGANEFRLAA